MLRLFSATLLILAVGTSFAIEIAIGKTVDFATDIRPILSDKCFSCHGPDAKTRKADLRLDKLEGLRSVLSGGNPELLARIFTNDPEDIMPPKDKLNPLTLQEQSAVREWVAQGANLPMDDRHWAFIPPTRPVIPPSGKDSGWIRNAIDNFTARRLRHDGNFPAPTAPKETLLRRVTYDLTGLPPTIEEQEAFMADDSPGAYEKVVDRLLGTSSHAEHATRFWLDAARYADTDGYQNDRYRYMHVWRDWVIRAFQQNMPFDRFITEQMAGDLLEDRDFYTQVATGFNRNHRINSEGGSIPDEWIVEYVADRVETLGTVFLGLTFNCSRCHDHKYDPVTQKDYYSLFAFFNNIDEAGLGPNNGNSPPFIPVPDSWPELDAGEAKYVLPEEMKIKVVQVSVPRPQPGSPNTVMVLHERGGEPRKTYRLIRGQYDNPDKSMEIGPAIPEILGGWKDCWPKDRIGLSNWLTSPENPLVSRVTMNRLWQRFFGEGIVKTSENFGSQGNAPVDQELLDWLAMEFVDGGWDYRAMEKLVVMSATYRQDTRSGNVQRRRLHPYEIRDTALYASGLLVSKVGGVSVKPYMPPNIWRSISNNKYTQDHGESLYRRSLYTYWRRTIPPPTMMTFNSSDREICSVRKDKTNTPLQALTLLNNITFVEASRILAERMMREQCHPESRVTHAFRLVIGRKTNQEEVARLVEDFHFYLQGFQTDPDSAKNLLKIGEAKADPSLKPAEVAAYGLVANTLFNLDEAIVLN
jgi:hypothetical protein